MMTALDWFTGAVAPQHANGQLHCDEDLQFLSPENLEALTDDTLELIAVK